MEGIKMCLREIEDREIYQRGRKDMFAEIIEHLKKYLNEDYRDIIKMSPEKEEEDLWV